MSEALSMNVLGGGRYDDNVPHARRLRGGRTSVPFQTYFLTKCIEDRRPLLAVPAATEIVIESLGFVRAQGNIKLLEFVIMPDHYHAVVTLLPGNGNGNDQEHDHDLSNLMRRIGSYTANRIRQSLKIHHPIWQADGFYDRAGRTEQDMLDAVEYVEHNPVRKGLAALPEKWLFSSAHPSRRGMLDWDWWV
jgi:putative transposase